MSHLEWMFPEEDVMLLDGHHSLFVWFGALSTRQEQQESVRIARCAAPLNILISISPENTWRAVPMTETLTHQ